MESPTLPTICNTLIYPQIKYKIKERVAETERFRGLIFDDSSPQDLRFSIGEDQEENK